MTAALEADRLYRFFRSGDEEVLALAGVSLVVHPGELIAVSGPSGSGKSTMLACLAGLDEPSGGSVRVAGQRMTSQTENERARLRRTHIGMLLQTGNLLPQLTVAQNMRLAQRIARRGTALPALLERLGLADRADALPSRISGGEEARAGLGVALATGPAVLLADEPTGELDAVAEEHVLALLRDTAAEGTAVLVVTHSARVLEVADRVVPLEDGRIAA